ncbi:hypothetical protein FB451DRAFT_1569867 [Mycena latifolia]|nr:hypothetical protein FB451DRAFT_1569867 [Mycena latifolia]
MNADLATRLAGIPGGPVNKLKQKDLIVLAEALGVPYKIKGPGKQSVPEIKAILKATLESAGFGFKEEFQKFITYRPGNGKTAPAKTSADKVLQDNLQSKSDEVPASGAHKKLLEGEGKSDPPPQYKRLGGGPKKEEDREVKEDEVGGDGSEDERSSQLSSVPAGTQMSDTGSPKKGPKAAPETDGLPIVVHFKGPENTDNREVWLPPSERSQISVLQAEDDSGGFTTSLKKLLPLALSHNSPIKKDGKAKLAIIGPLGGRLNLGTVDQFDDDRFPETLALIGVDQYKLRKDPAGLVCSVFWEPKNAVAATGNRELAQKPHEPHAAFDLMLMGPESKPLEIAKARETARAALEDAEEQPMVRYLRKKLNGPARKGPAINKIGDMLQRHKRLAEAMKWVKENWSNGPNKYCIPDDDDSAFKGMTFKAEHVQAAMRIRHTTANTDDKLFRYQRLRDDHTHKAEAYVEDGLHKALFDGMSIKEWDEYFDRAKVAKEAEEQKAAREEERKRKRAREEKGEKKEKDRKKKKKKHIDAEEGEDRPRAGSSRHRSDSLDGE